jgi:Ser-tRNA(Ala) deacylase AlaX
MTELLFQTDSYQRTFEAEVTALDEGNHGVVLNRTAFYPGGGGQPYDTGSWQWEIIYIMLAEGEKPVRMSFTLSKTVRHCQQLGLRSQVKLIGKGATS